MEREEPPPSPVEAYFAAIAAGETEELERLLATHPSLPKARAAPAYAPDGPVRCTGLHAAAHAGRPEAVRILIRAGADLEARTEEGRTALHDSIEFGCRQVTDLLIEQGAEVDVCSAAILGLVERLEELLEEDPRRANDHSTGLSPLGWAAFGNRVESARVLLEHGARIQGAPLLCAASVGHVEVARFLLDQGADPNTLDPEGGGTALHAACGMKYGLDPRPLVRLLIERGANTKAENLLGETPLELVRRKLAEQERDPTEERRPYAELIDLLIDLGR